MSYRNSSDFATETSPFRRYAQGLVRRLAITIAKGTKWQMRGQKGGDGGDEVLEIEIFQGIGFFARPPASGTHPQAIATSIGSPKHQVAVAFRDEGVRQAIDAQVPDDASAMFNTVAIFVIKPDGSLEARTIGGTALSLATKADIDALRSWASSHFHTGGTIFGNTGSPTVAPPSATGTLRFKAE